MACTRVHAIYSAYAFPAFLNRCSRLQAYYCWCLTVTVLFVDITVIHVLSHLWCLPPIPWNGIHPTLGARNSHLLNNYNRHDITWPLDARCSHVSDWIHMWSAFRNLNADKIDIWLSVWPSLGGKPLHYLVYLHCRLHRSCNRSWHPLPRVCALFSSSSAVSRSCTLHEPMHQNHVRTATRLDNGSCQSKLLSTPPTVLGPSLLLVSLQTIVFRTALSLQLLPFQLLPFSTLVYSTYLLCSADSLLYCALSKLMKTLIYHHEWVPSYYGSSTAIRVWTTYRRSTAPAQPQNIQTRLFLMSASKPCVETRVQIDDGCLDVQNMVLTPSSEQAYDFV